MPPRDSLLPDWFHRELVRSHGRRPMRELELFGVLKEREHPHPEEVLGRSVARLEEDVAGAHEVFVPESFAVLVPRIDQRAHQVRAGDGRGAP